MVVVNKSPLVRLHISLTGEVEQPQEVVRKVTEEDEEVEVDGFIFKRKRRRTQQESREEVLHESEDTQQSQVPHPQPGQGDEGHLIRSCATPADRAALQVKAMGLLSTFEGVSDPQQVLPEFCKKLAQRSLQEAVIPEDMKERLAATWPADVEEAVRCALSNGTLVCRIPTEAGSVKLNQDLDRESQRIRLAYLQTQVQRLRAEKEEWRRLAEEHARMTVELESQGPAPSQHLEMPGPSRDTLALSQELATARQDAHRNVSLQVDGLCALVDGVEELVGRAEHQCSVLQARWHRDKFRKFPHVDSPARLIKDIIQPVPLS